MGLQHIGDPRSVTNPVTIDEARAHCRVSSRDEDALIAGYLLAAAAVVEGDTRRSILTQQWRKTYDYNWPQHQDANRDRIDRDGYMGGYMGGYIGSWGAGNIRASRIRQRFIVPRPPLQNVNAITYVDMAGVVQTLDPSQYLVALVDTGEWYVEPAYGVIWPQIRPQLATITLDFTAGYGSSPGNMPEPLRVAMLMLVGLWYDNRVPIEVASAVTELPYGISSLVQRYRIFYT